MIFGAIQSVIMIIILMSFGYFAAYKGWVSKGTAKFITKLIVNITLPCTILNTFLSNFTSERLFSSGKYIIVAFISVLLFYFIGRLVARLAKIDNTKRGVFTALFSFSNSVFIGFPVAMAIFGAEGMIFAIFYFFANSTCFNSVGFMMIADDGRKISGKKEVNSFKAVLKRILQPPIVAIAVSIILVFFNVRLPEFANSTLSFTGAITSPLSLIFVGTIVHRFGFKKLSFEKGLPLVMVGRFLLAPLTMYAVAVFIGIDSFATQVFVVQMALPSMVQTVIYAELCGADSGYATKGLVLSTLLSLIILPVLVILFGGI